MGKKYTLLLLSALTSLMANGQTFSSSSAVSAGLDYDCPGTGSPGTSTINVTAIGRVAIPSQVTINVKLVSDCQGTVWVDLVAPDATTCRLINLVNRDGDCSGYCPSYIAANTLSFNSSFTTPIPSPVTGTIPAGNYKPTAGTWATAIGNLSTFLTGKSVNGNWALKGYSDVGSPLEINSWSISFGATALPLNLLSFGGKQTSKQQVALNWTTANEDNVLAFNVERSEDGSSFEQVGAIPALGSGDNSYSFTDQLPSSGPNLFYRLKTMDKNGTIYLSNTLRLANYANVINQIIISPNPANEAVSFNLGNNQNLVGTQMRIVDMMGKTIATIELTDAKTTMNISSLPAGTYICSFANGDIERFVKSN